MTDFKFPVCVAADGTVTHPDTLPYDPYALRWVEGAASTLSRSTLLKYPEGLSDLREKTQALAGRKLRLPEYPAYGFVTTRPALFRQLHGRPLPEDGPGGDPEDGRY